MNSVRCIAAILLIFVNYYQCCAKRYTNYSLYDLYPQTRDHFKYLDGLRKNQYLDVIFISETNEYPIQVLVHRYQESAFLQKIYHFSIPTLGILQDVQRAFDQQVVKENSFNPYTNKWEYVRTLDDTYDWLNETARLYPFTLLESIGKSAEGRHIYAFSIKESLENKNFKSLKVMVEAGIHGNEFLSPAMATYLINELLTSSKENFADLRQRYFWYFIPILNPDGYVYAQEEDRFWMKNRRKLSGHSIGVNLNRNFGYRFGMNDASKDQDSPYYCGPSAFSEPESRALRDFIFRKHEDLTFYFSIHGYGQKFIVPYSDSEELVVNYHEVRDFANRTAENIARISKKKYKVGTASEVLGKQYSGDSVSWVKKTYKVQYAMTIQLRDDGKLGHALPNTEIIPACSEMAESLTRLMMASGKNHELSQLKESSASLKWCPLLIVFMLFVVIPLEINV